MALGIYKMGQGYWVRVLTAVFAGTLVLAAGAWAWRQAEVYIRPPTPTWQVFVRAVEGQLQAGEQVRLIGDHPMTQEADAELGVAVAQEIRTDRIVVGSIEMQADGLNPAMAQELRSGDGAFAARVVTATGIPAFEPIYAQLAVIGLVLLVGGGLTYWFVAANARSVEFLIATDGEMKKVNWSTRREIIGSTWVVVVATFLIAAILFGIDFVFASFFRMIDVLETTR